jgi:hypothetical protein
VPLVQPERLRIFVRDCDCRSRLHVNEREILLIQSELENLRGIGKASAADRRGSGTSRAVQPDALVRSGDQHVSLNRTRLMACGEVKLNLTLEIIRPLGPGGLLEELRYVKLHGLTPHGGVYGWKPNCVKRHK